jgi:hypothetical protein
VEDEDTVPARTTGPESRAVKQGELSPSPSDTPGIADGNAQIVIDPDIIGGMTDTACERYKDCIVKFAGALAREASRLEEADRAEDVEKPEITATMVVKANDFIRHPPSSAPLATIPILTAQAVAFATAMLTPIFGAALHSAWQWTVTIICGILALVAQIFAIVAVRRR